MVRLLAGGSADWFGSATGDRAGFPRRRECPFPRNGGNPESPRPCRHTSSGRTVHWGILRLRACAELVVGQDDLARRDMQLALRLADYVRQQPWAESVEVRLNVLLDALQSVWEGLAEHRWNEQQLAGLQAPLKYRRTAGIGFILYSVGLDRADDGGQPPVRDTALHGFPLSSFELNRNEWVWTCPDAAAAT